MKKLLLAGLMLLGALVLAPAPSEACNRCISNCECDCDSPIGKVECAASGCDIRPRWCTDGGGDCAVF